MVASVVDELVVTLSLQADEYRKAEAEVERNISRTERKTQERARIADRRDKDQQRRLKDTGAMVRGFATQVAAAGAVVSGLGAALGASLTNLIGFNTDMRRNAVGTALSNREMQAWSATARRLGADAKAGQQAIADLSREQKLGQLTGNAPTIQALSRIGVNASPDRAIEDILADAQRIYRAAPTGQQQQIESTLVASGASADLILMIKSEIDAREAYARSFAQASEENRKALDQAADALESMKAQAIGVASTLLVALLPAIETGAEKLADFAVRVANVANDLTDAGSSADNLQQTLDRNLPTVGYLFQGFRMLGDVISGTGAILKATFTSVTQSLSDFGAWFDRLISRVRTPWSTTENLQQTGNRLRERLRERLGFGAANDGVTPLQRGVLAFDRAITGAYQWAKGVNGEDFSAIRPLDESPVGGSAQDIMSHLVTQYGKTPAQAAAIVSNWHGESGLRANAYNPEGGGDGARGIAQWRGARIRAFQARYGVKPDQASIAQQIEFAMTDPYERQLMMRSFAGRTGAEALGVGYSRVYEAHGNVAEDARRGRHAAQLERDWNGPTASAGTSINIQNMNVSTPDAAGVVGGLQRISGTQSYNTVVR